MPQTFSNLCSAFASISAQEEPAMKAVAYQKERNAFTFTKLPVPKPQNEYDVLIEVHAVGLNPLDAKINQ